MAARAAAGAAITRNGCAADIENARRGRREHQESRKSEVVRRKSGDNPLSTYDSRYMVRGENPGIAAIIVAAGAGHRMGRPRPKQFLELAGLPVLVHTVRRFAALDEITRIVVVLPPDKTDFLEPFILEYRWRGRVLATAGGEHRQDSVAAGFRVLSPNAGLVLVHDGVRPFADSELIRRVIEKAKVCGAAVPAVPVSDTLKRAEGEMLVATVERNSLYAAQTPQGFHYALLAEALERARRDGFYGTDESVLVERLGRKVCLVEGSRLNIKITSAEDLLLAEAICARLLPAAQ